jgi:hypothetical protein
MTLPSKINVSFRRGVCTVTVISLPIGGRKTDERRALVSDRFKMIAS